MTEVEKRITNNIENGLLMEFLGSENVEKLKSNITDAIIQQITDDLHDSHDYIISPDDIAQGIVDDIIERAKDKIRPKIEKILYEKAMAKLGLED